jgi:hypothetical protein
MSLPDTLAKLEPKDWITLCASMSALGVSLLSYWQRSGEGKFALRKQLTDIFEKLTSLNIEAQKFRADGSGYPPNYLRLLNDQRRFFVRQASYITRRIRSLVTPYEYLLIAGGFDDIDDPDQAEYYYRLAIDSAAQAMDRGIALRGYGRYLFSQGLDRLGDARRYFQRSAEAFSESNDRHVVYRADTYERWSNLEREWGHTEEATKHLRRAATEFGQLSNPGRRRLELERLRTVMAALHPTTDSKITSERET